LSVHLNELSVHLKNLKLIVRLKYKLCVHLNELSVHLKNLKLSVRLKYKLSVRLKNLKRKLSVHLNDVEREGGAEDRRPHGPRPFLQGLCAWSTCHAISGRGD